MIFCTCIWKFTLTIHVLRCRRRYWLSWSCWSSIIISVVISIICRCYRLWSFWFWFWFRLRLWFRSWSWTWVWSWIWCRILRNVVDWCILRWITRYLWYFVSFSWIIWINWFQWLTFWVYRDKSWYIRYFRFICSWFSWIFRIVWICDSICWCSWDIWNP